MAIMTTTQGDEIFAAFDGAIQYGLLLRATDAKRRNDQKSYPEFTIAKHYRFPFQRRFCWRIFYHKSKRMLSSM
jgi:hypothetical protein